MRDRIMLFLGVLAIIGGPALAQDSGITPLHPALAARTYDAACSACHYRGEGRTPFGTRGPLADRSPDELVQYILFGKAPEYGEGQMPGFAAALTDADVTRLVTWLRATSQPDAPWAGVAARVAKMRTSGQRED